MARYRMQAYRAGKVWQTHNIFADDDTTAKTKAKAKFRELEAELVSQDKPKIDDPRLEGFTLHKGERPIV